MSIYKYHCPECKVKVSTEVKPSEPPTHPCSRHVNKIRPLEEVSKKPKSE